MTAHCHLTIDNTLTRIHNYGTVLNPGKGTVYYVWLQSALAGMSNKYPNYQGVLIFWSAYMISTITKCVDYADPLFSSALINRFHYILVPRVHNICRLLARIMHSCCYLDLYI